MRKNDAFVAKIANTGLAKICVAIFALTERLPTSATLLQSKRLDPDQHLIRMTRTHSRPTNSQRQRARQRRKIYKEGKNLPSKSF